MSTEMTTRADIEQFLALRRIAVVGVSRNSKDFGNELFRELKRRGYTVIPVNPHAEVLEGERCYARVQNITPRVEGALLMTAPELGERVISDCAEAGIKSAWLYGIGGPGKATKQAVELCRQHDIAVIAGYCPYMFLPNSQFYHRLHGFVAKLSGGYPH